MVEAGGVGISRLAENTQLIENSQPIEKPKSLIWAKWCTWRVRGGTSGYSAWVIEQAVRPVTMTIAAEASNFVPSFIMAIRLDGA